MPHSRAIDGFSQELLTNYTGRLDDKGRRFLERNREGSQRMAQLIDDILLLSHLSRGDLQYQPVDLSGLARKSPMTCPSGARTRRHLHH